jgi:hypothetical protein
MEPARFGLINRLAYAEAAGRLAAQGQGRIERRGCSAAIALLLHHPAPTAPALADNSPSRRRLPFASGQPA